MCCALSFSYKSPKALCIKATCISGGAGHTYVNPAAAVPGFTAPPVSQFLLHRT